MNATDNKMKSKFYNKEGDIIEFDDNITYGIPFFRKEFTKYSANEKDIARIIKKHSMINVVHIYHVNHNYYDAELLETPIVVTKENIDKIMIDMENAKIELQKKGIMYIDWKIDNIGYSKKENKYKLFDFDCSGICSMGESSEEWIKPPPNSWLYKKATKNNIYEPIDMDNYSFIDFCNEIKLFAFGRNNS